MKELVIKREVKELPKKVINLRVSEEEDQKIKELADKYANGNRTAWMAYASTHYVPPKRDLVPKKYLGKW